MHGKSLRRLSRLPQMHTTRPFVWATGWHPTLTEAPRAFFQEFPVISVDSRKLFGAHGQGLRVVIPEKGDFILALKASRL